MKPNKLILGVIACTLGTSMYAHQLHAENSLQVPNNGNSKDSQTLRTLFFRTLINHIYLFKGAIDYYCSYNKSLSTSERFCILFRSINLADMPKEMGTSTSKIGLSPMNKASYIWQSNFVRNVS